ncbi:hypothetical protein [Cellulophaga omnivescoria]|uniref:hypothetical protein n=1 Tax=Cellulophaga omnivescoria TaxID=1888890 RepID=UPI0022EFE62B|nr:hypothetical protein [Cellulophaga omnivescoria]WBU90142.1 hypothetical protein PBN93_03815 [Cellulophaga omnivescoria]
MKVTDFTYLLQKPESISSVAQINQLEEIITDYPYFQAARAIHLKGLKNTNSFKYNNALKVTAAHTANRDVLFDFITSPEFLNNTTTVKEIRENANLKKLNVISEEVASPPNMLEESEDNPLPQNINDAEKILDDSLFETKEVTKKEETKEAIEKSPEVEIQQANPETTQKTSTSITETEVKDELEISIANEELEIKSKEDAFENTTEKNTLVIPTEKLEEEKTEAEKLNIGAPLHFTKNEKYSFAQWLELTNPKPTTKKEEVKEQAQEEKEIEKVTPLNTKADLKQNKAPKTSLEKKEPKQKKNKKFDLIDKFIKTNPKITPAKNIETKVDISSSVKLNKDELMTETLAKVYLEQKKYKKAIQAYKILSLKYPEKSSFFANRIKSVEKIQKENI